jgi:hypothetical protein
MRVNPHIARIALVVVLLAGWQAALKHPIEHLDALGGFVHVNDGHSHDDESQRGSLCDLLAALTACAAPAPAAFAAAQSDFESPGYPSSAPRLADAPPFLSQGPPASV